MRDLSAGIRKFSYRISPSNLPCGQLFKGCSCALKQGEAVSLTGDPQGESAEA